MRLALSILAALCLCAGTVHAATGKVIKVLPMFLDAEGRVALSPSLFERDAYQDYLRLHRDKRAGIRFSVQWKIQKAVWEPLKLRVHLRGTAEGNLPKEYVMEKKVEPRKFFSRWTEFDLTGDEYKGLGEVTAWRVTLWEGDQLLGEQQSFLW